MRDLEGLVIGLAILQTGTLPVRLSSPSAAAAIGVQIAGVTTQANTRNSAQVVKLIAMAHTDVSRQVDHGDNCAIGYPVPYPRPRTTVPKAASRAAGEVRKAVEVEDAVVDGDALFDGGMAEQVVDPANARRIAFNGDLAALDAQIDTSAVAGFVLEARLAGREDLAGMGIDGLAENVANDRKVVCVFLRNAEPVDEHRNPCQYRFADTRWTGS
ncbi:hypothetical protein AOR11_23945 [Vibrio alginolyticus]|nr:hypothetical protein AOR11_23945 [Vibrio alginolyticus]